MRSRMIGSRSVEWMRCVPVSMHSPLLAPKRHGSMSGSARRAPGLTAAGEADEADVAEPDVAEPDIAEPDERHPPMLHPIVVIAARVSKVMCVRSIKGGPAVYSVIGRRHAELACKSSEAALFATAHPSAASALWAAAMSASISASFLRVSSTSSGLAFAM